MRRVNFTGSTRVGRIIAEVAARYLKPVLLELGGKAPLIVLDDADLDNAVRAAAFGSFMHSGQICMSTERIVVHPDIADSFAQKLAEKAKSLTAGNPRTSNAALGLARRSWTGGSRRGPGQGCRRQGREAACRRHGGRHHHERHRA